MKDLMSKIKTLDYKQLALNHGEKIGIGVAGLMVVVICLFLTSWAAEYTGEPRDMEKKAEDVAERLKNNKWTEERQKEFPYLLAENELPKVIERLDPAEYEWLVDPSPKLYPRQQPADEVEWLPVASVEVHYMQFPMGVEVPQEKPDATEEDAKSKPAKPEKPGSKKGKDSKGAEDPLMAGARPIGAMEGASGFSSAANEKASGRRVVAVLGVIEVRRQQQALKTALHAGSLSEVRDRLNYRAFRLERQRAVPGPDPWSGPWKEVKTGESIAVLGEASDFDADLVAPKYTHVDLTSPLPRRLDGDWDPNLVVHSRIPCLSEEEREMELAATKAASEALKEAGDTDEPIEGGGGFSRIQKDANRIRNRAQSNPEASGLMSDIMKKMMPGMGEMGASGARGKGMRQPPGSAMAPMGASGSAMSRAPMPGMGSMGMNPPGMGAAGGRTSRMPGTPGMSGMPAMAGMSGMAGMGSMGPMGGIADMGADIQLFRYFDFDVEPGECYRYRVQLIVDNPSFEETFVSQSSVAEQKFRETPWSAPSPPAVVERDVDYGLVEKASSQRGRNDGVDLSVVQFDTNLGSFIMDQFKVLFGAYVGKEKQQSLHLDFVEPSFKEEPVTFSSKDVLLDGTATPTKFSDAVAEDLKLDPKKSRKLLDMAVALDRFGEIVELDAGSIKALKPAKKRVEEEREPYEEIKETRETEAKKRKESKDSASSLDDYMKDGKGKKDKKKGKKGKADNPLKGGFGSMMMPSGMMPGMGMPPSSSPSPKRGR